MSQYASLEKTSRQIYSVVVDYMLEKIAFEQFKQDRGTAVHKVLPDKSDAYKFCSNGFKGVVYPNERIFTNPVYKGNSLTSNNILRSPETFQSMVGSLYSLWEETFGEFRRMSSQPSHPGQPPMKKEDILSALNKLEERVEILKADPMMEDLVSAVEGQNYSMVAQFLNIDQDTVSLLNPGGPHELTELFTQGDIHIVYKDSDIALLKPEYDHEIREKVLNQQASGFRRIRLQGEQPELAFVVGIDDTPTGLFVHAVDGTRLELNQNVSRRYIHNVMGFDYNYNHSPVLDYSVGDRVRLQGDLAVEYIDNKTVSDSTRSNIPIDNHLSMLNHGEVVGDKAQEPIDVDVPSLATLNIMHDEHENVSVELPEGRHRFYLLPRGLQPESERPSW